MNNTNYFMIDGKRIPMSDETAKEIMAAKEEEVKTYNDILNNLFKNKKSYYINDKGNIKHTINTITNIYDNSNSSKTKEQLKAILALNKLCNVAKYLNDGWLPDWDNTREKKYYLTYNMIDNTIVINYNSFIIKSNVYFKTKELAKKAIEILGKEEIIKALTLNY